MATDPRWRPKRNAGKCPLARRHCHLWRLIQRTRALEPGAGDLRSGLHCEVSDGQSSRLPMPSYCPIKRRASCFGQRQSLANSASARGHYNAGARGALGRAVYMSVGRSFSDQRILKRGFGNSNEGSSVAIRVSAWHSTSVTPCHRRTRCENKRQDVPQTSLWPHYELSACRQVVKNGPALPNLPTGAI